MADSSPPSVPSDSGLSAWRRFLTLDVAPKPRRPSYPFVPRTTASRLGQPDAAPTPFPPAPTAAPPLPDAMTLAPSQPATVLYLAYGSNLAAETFLGRRGIRPLSQINVSAPSLRLVFDLPGIPYMEPCFANTAIRKLPPGGTPPKLPPGMPDIPDLPDPPHFPESGAWDKGLLGVVYEVTREDFARILASEGGGASYREIVVPCLALPPSVAVPEKPPVPELPRPFLARTLYAPRLPDVPDNTKGDGEGEREGDDDDGPDVPEPPSWFRKLLLPVRRPDPDYAQPSARYLGLIRDGAREHELPAEYQAYLASLGSYAVTTRRQRVGRVLFVLVWAPVFLAFFLASQLIAARRREGTSPPWVVGAMAVLINLVWMSYDAVAKPLFGDGERTMDGGDETGNTVPAQRQRRLSLWRRQEAGHDEEKRGLLVDMSN